jgi:hypothetical protein
MQLFTPGAFRRLLAFTVLAVIFFSPAMARAAQEAKSAPGAKQLAQALDAAKLDAIAVADPSVAGGFIAAILIPETQLLVVSAKYAAPTLLADKIKAGDYRGVYMDLHSAAVSGSKIFVQDMGPDGLVSKGDNGDSWEEAGKEVTFDGQWKKAKLTEAEYTRELTDANERYSKMLALLVAQVKQAKP